MLACATLSVTTTAHQPALSPSHTATVASSNLLDSIYTTLANFTTCIFPTAAIAHAKQILNADPPQTFNIAGTVDSGLANSLRQTLRSGITSLQGLIEERSTLENTSLVLALCTFGVLIMSWASRLGNLGRFSPFTRSPPQGSTKVRDEDFSYITADDLRRHGPDGATGNNRTSSESLGPPRDTDMLVLRNKRNEYTVHFPAYSIAKGELTVGQLREHAAKKAGTADPRRIKILHRGKNLKDDSRTCRGEGLQHGSELLLTIADPMSSAEGSEDDDDDDDLADGGVDVPGEGEGRRRRNRGKKSKKKAKCEERVADNLGVPPSSSQPSTRPHSPKPPPTPSTPIDKIKGFRGALESLIPQVEAFQRSPPEDPGKKDYEHKRLSETVLTQVLLKLDGVDTEGDPEARAKRKELVKDTQKVLNDIDAVMR